ncbi:MAG TPA: ABC transporter permease [Patescibacteria group bacterium]|nr:ABC transporter permease [Patescibacteria group bacterium]
MSKLWGFLTPQNKTLLRQLVITDFKLRYQGSVLGYVWSLLKPLLLFTVLYVVFTKILPLGKDIPHYPAYLLLGIVVWTFFAEATIMGMGSIVGRGDLIRKVKISKPLIVVAATLSAGVNFCLNMLVVVIFMIFNNVTIQWQAIFFPIVIIELVILAMSISFFLSALYVRFRDFAAIWEVVLQTMFYATPIIYVFSLKVTKSVLLMKIMSLNPLAQIIQDTRYMLITPETLTTHAVLSKALSYVLPLVLVTSMAIASIWFFRRSAKTFAENL